MKKILVPCLLPLALAACGEGDLREVARFPSPVGGLDAVVARMDTGAESPYAVVLTKPGENPKKGARVFLADRTEGPKVTWQDADHLTISCDQARIWTYRNFWTSPEGKATVAVALACGEKGWRP